MSGSVPKGGLISGYARVWLDELSALLPLRLGARRSGGLRLADVQRDYEKAVAEVRSADAVTGLVPEADARERSVLYAMAAYWLRPEEDGDEGVYDAFADLLLDQAPQSLFRNACIECESNDGADVAVWFSLGELLMLHAVREDLAVAEGPSRTRALVAQLDAIDPAWRQTYAALWEVPGVRAVTALFALRHAPDEWRNYEWQGTLATCLAPVSEISPENAATLMVYDIYRRPRADWPHWDHVLGLIARAGLRADTAVTDTTDWPSEGRPEVGRVYPLQEVFTPESMPIDERSAARARWWQHQLLSPQLEPIPLSAHPPVPRL